MSTPANLYPGLNDIADVFEELPIETSKYLTLLHEIDAKCVNSIPILNSKIQNFLSNNNKDNSENKETSLTKLIQINRLFEELMPSLEEKMHVSSIMVETLDRLNERLELSYETCIRNEEIPSQLRLGNNNHPAMHLHYELMEKIDNERKNKDGKGSNSNIKSSQALKSESRREAMEAKKRNSTKEKDNEGNKSRKRNYTNSQNSSARTSTNNTVTNNNNNKNNTTTEPKRRRRRLNNDAITTTTSKNSVPDTTTTTKTVSAVNSIRSSKASSVTNATGSNTQEEIATIAGTGTETEAISNNGTITLPIHQQVQQQSSNIKIHRNDQGERVNEYGEPVYCYCNQVAYGEMVGCDGTHCELEWFHLPCIGMTTLPKGKWYCADCKKKQKKA